MNQASENKKSEDVTIGEMIAAQEELKTLKKEYGIEEREKGVSRVISRFFERQDEREELLLSRRKYILLAVFTGVVGGHRFYARQYLLGILYLALCWCGISIAMTIIDLLVVIPKPVDENGMIRI